MWLHRSAISLSKLILRQQRLSMCGFFASTKKDLYQTLGVPRAATQNQIKKAYYKLAQQHHPDKNPNSEAKDKFAEISNAYEILSDSGKRQIYDQTGSAQASGNFGQDGAGFEDLFSQFRKAQGHGGQGMGGMNFEDLFGDMFEMGGEQREVNMLQPENILCTIELQFSEAVNGTIQKIEYRKKQKCGTCKGSKAKPGTKPQKCSVCQGTGAQTIRQGMLVMRTVCGTCNGEGKRITSFCQTCSGTGIETKKVSEQIKFPKGISSNANMKFRGKGHLDGDLIINVTVRNHPKINRQGNDAHSDVQIPVVDAVLGTTVKIETIYGKEKEVNIPQGIQNGENIKIPSEGFYMVNTLQKGSHILTIRVKIPKNLKQEEKQLFQKLKELEPEKK